MNSLSPEIRRALVDSLVQQHMDRPRATIAVDLAAQACDQAHEAFNRTVKASPDGDMALCVTFIAAQILSFQMNGLFEGAIRLSKAVGLSQRPIDLDLFHKRRSTQNG